MAGCFNENPTNNPRKEATMSKSQERRLKVQRLSERMYNREPMGEWGYIVEKWADEVAKLEQELEQWRAENQDIENPSIRPMTEMENLLMDEKGRSGQLEIELEQAQAELDTANKTIDFAEVVAKRLEIDVQDSKDELEQSRQREVRLRTYAQLLESGSPRQVAKFRKALDLDDMKYWIIPEEHYQALKESDGD